MWVVAVAAVVGMCFFIHHSGYEKGYAKAEAEGIQKMVEYQALQRSALEAATREVKRIEDDLQTKLLTATAEKEIEIKNLNDAHKRALDSVRRRAARRASSPAVSTGPGTPTIVSSGRDCTGAELSREDAEFLIGEAANADTLKQIVKHCRAAYKRLRDSQIKIE
jgi:hypothetical protein